MFSLKASLEAAKVASRKILDYQDNVIHECLIRLADCLVECKDEIIAANREDLDRISSKDPVYDRVLLDEQRINSIAMGLKKIASLDAAMFAVLEERQLENGLDLKKVRVPLGVVGVIFEARPNVVVDIFGLCLRSRNVCVLKGGSKSEKSNEVLVDIIKKVLKEYDLDENLVTLLPNDREIVGEMLRAVDYIDVLIPRGGRGLIDFVRENSLVPVIETGAGVVHTYFDRSADLEMGKRIVFNAKTSRPSVCNALDCLLVHEDRAEDLALLCGDLALKGVVIFADEKAYEALKGNYDADLLKRARNEDFGREFLDYKISIKVVSDVDEAITHINKYGSKHSEAIISEDSDMVEKFLRRVDAAAVYHNASTRFTDGSEFGLGAEIGISTQKLHARGPMGIRELTTYKWQVLGNGQVR